MQRASVYPHQWASKQTFKSIAALDLNVNIPCIFLHDSNNAPRHLQSIHKINAAVLKALIYLSLDQGHAYGCSLLCRKMSHVNQIESSQSVHTLNRQRLAS